MPCGFESHLSHQKEAALTGGLFFDTRMGLERPLRKHAGKKGPRKAKALWEEEEPGLLADGPREGNGAVQPAL